MPDALTIDRQVWADIVKTEDTEDGGLYVYGKLSDGHTRDAHGQITDAETFQPALKKWATMWGNIRQEHQPHVVGVAQEVVFDGDNSFLGAKIIDENAIKLVKAGALKGLSYGLIKDTYKVVKQPGKPDRVVITNPDAIAENSLVDRPSNPEARIELWKAAPEDYEAPVVEPDLTKDDETAQVALADMAMGIIRQLIIAEASETDDDETWDLYTLVQTLCNLRDFKLSEENEAVMNALRQSSGVEKSGAEFSAKNKAMLQTMHDGIVKMAPEVCGGAQGDDMDKAAVIEIVNEILAERPELTKAVEVDTSGIEALAETVKGLEAQVEEMGGKLAPSPAYLGGALKPALTKSAEDPTRARMTRLSLNTDPSIAQSALAWLRNNPAPQE